MTKNKLNTAVEVTYKDGSIEKFESIEAASKKTGITEKSIQLRASKPGSTGHDKITFKWLDEYTRRYYLAKRSKRKGNSTELEVVKRLKEIGFTGCVRSGSESKNADNNKIDIIDLENKLPVNIQVKNTQNLPNYFTIRGQCSDKSKPFVIIWKKASEGGKSSPGTVAIIDVELFYKLLEKYV